MHPRPASLIALLGIVFLAAAQCGYSTDMLTTNSGESGSGTEPRTESTKEIDTEETVSSESANMETESDTGADSAACSHGEILPSEVLLIGDSWISLPGPRVGELARDAGIIASDEDYVYRARVNATIENIVQQYDLYLASSDFDAKVVIMNGGGIEMYLARGAEDSGSSVSHVVETFSLFLNQLAGDGSVEYVIYTLYPELLDNPGVADLHPPMRAACTESVVPCFFFDLQPLWEGHPEYTRMDTLDPTSAGSDVIAAAIWQIMQDDCIAQ
jgi:hypothetical protein